MNKLFSLALTSVLASTLFLGASSYASLGAGKVTKFIGDDQFTTNVYDLAAKAGVKGEPKNQPWSGTFWPLRSGSTGNPYAERTSFKVNQLFGAKSNLRKFQRRMADLRVAVAKNKLSAADIRDLAPSEKYDLYLGDYDFTYTQSEWQSVSEQLKYIGRISLWEGSCHGWATAAIYEARPQHLFTVMSLDGKYLIPFYPDDLKALSTRLWANSLIQDYTVAQGLRCNVKHPKKDDFTGHVLDKACEGVNPGDFHVSVLEMVGVRKESFVVNRSNTRQVWNQPVAGYELNYFNPATDKDGDLAHSVVRREAYADPYAKFRDASVKSIVGVEMKLNYVSETTPTHKKSDESTSDKVKTLKLRYDLELDENNQVVGGEWRNKNDPTVSANDDQDDGYSDETADIPKYPGFLWKFQAAKPVAMSIADFDFQGDDPTQINRAVLVEASRKAAQFRYNQWNWDAEGHATTIKREELRPQPLGKVVNALINMAK